VSRGGLDERVRDIPRILGADVCLSSYGVCYERFRARYGGDPDWGARDDWGPHKAGSLLCLFIHQGVIPDDLLARLEPLEPGHERLQLDDRLQTGELPARLLPKPC
jgi:hypothetical protein